ncbi:MAG TPA: choice-of-anchor J domain-containing protein [Flavisolibacter sp.]|nr:choice-of-anchor J domain-containing protein [Flavisolibacter sp.]
MKNFTFLAFTVFSLLAIPAFAQRNCATDDIMRELFRTDPQVRLRYETAKRAMDAKVSQYLANPNAPSLRTTAIITIPVVVHIATDNPNLVTDAVVQRQIDTLNWYYGNAPTGDSLRVSEPFRTSYGRSQIRFCLAKRTPTDQPSTGINRITTSSQFTAGGSHPSTVAPAWNTQKYLNIWVIRFTGTTLGYAYYPNTWPAGDQRIGLVVGYQYFGSDAAYLDGTYNGGKTAVHEIGHYFDLPHTWGNGNDNVSCAADDGFSDTPPTNGPTFGCPGAAVTNSCSPTAPGIMFQNHMDYADDACMLLFSAQQVVRMETALNTSSDRNTLITSNGCVAVNSTADDAGVSAIITPANGSFVCNAAITPQVTIRNNGTSPLTSVTINTSLNGGPAVAFAWTGNLAPNATANVSLAGITATAGANILQVSTSLPNGNTDGNPSNDAATSNFTFTAAGVVPIQEGFEAAAFPPANWALVNPDGDFTWQRATVGRASTASMWINNFDADVAGVNKIDRFVSRPISTTGVTTLNISFDLAHKFFNNPSFLDTLTVLVSNNCGASYETVYKKWGATLATAGALATAYTNPVAADWRTETIAVNGAILTGGPVIVVFQNTSKWGNNIFIDNINIQKQSSRDMRLVSINTPTTGNSCSPVIAPSVTVQNNGEEPITSFEVRYSIDNGPVVTTAFPLQNLAPNATLTVPLTSSTTTSGSHSIKIYTANPTTATGTGDIQNNNDTLTRNFSVVTLAAPPLVEGFENNFPSSGWTLVNPNNNVTWVKASPGRNSNFAGFFDNFSNNVNNQIDEIRTPFTNTAGADSLIIRFDLAHKNYPGAPDTLTVLVSTDCGNTFTSVYKKQGATLATAGSSTGDYTAPVPGDWRTEWISLNNVFTNSGSVVVAIRNTNRFGNNIFIDNINIETLYKTDARLVSINQPAALLCATNTTPSVTVRNVGKENITALNVSYTIDNGPVQTTNVTGINLARNAELNVNLPAASGLATGAHILKAYTWNPVSVVGTGDNYLLNDTLTKSFSVVGTTAAPLVESFEGTFPPANWSIVNPDGGLTWRAYSGGNGNVGSAYLNAFSYTSRGQRDDLVSPNITYQNVDSVTLAFDLSASTRLYPGGTVDPQDTLEVLVSQDCGASFTTIYKKWGEDLQTVNNPNQPNTTQFFPQGTQQWRREILDLTGFGPNGPLLFAFRVTNNNENNIFIDNVNLTTRVLPERIRTEGYLVLPNPFQNSFNVWHVEQPTTLKYISVFNSIGQLIWTKQFNGNATNYEKVDLTGKAAGIYVVKLGYEDASRNVSERVVKY